MSTITLPFEIKMLVPTLQIYVEYFNNKYPCTTEENDGSNMSVEDEVKYATYEHLLSVYNKFKVVADDEYKEMLTEAKKQLSSTN